MSIVDIDTMEVLARGSEVALLVARVKKLDAAVEDARSVMKIQSDAYTRLKSENEELAAEVARLRGRMEAAAGAIDDNMPLFARRVLQNGLKKTDLSPEEKD